MRCSGYSRACKGCHDGNMIGGPGRSSLYFMGEKDPWQLLACVSGRTSTGNSFDLSPQPPVRPQQNLYSRGQSTETRQWSSQQETRRSV